MLLFGINIFLKLLVCIVCTSNVDTHCAQIQMEKIPTHQISQHQHHPTHPIHFCCMPGGAYSQEGWLQNMCNFAQTEIWVLTKHYVFESRFNVTGKPYFEICKYWNLIIIGFAVKTQKSWNWSKKFAKTILWDLQILNFDHYWVCCKNTKKLKLIKKVSKNMKLATS